MILYFKHIGREIMCIGFLPYLSRSMLTKSTTNCKACICLHLSNNWNRSSKLLMHHKSKNTHHGSTAIVELNSTLLQLGFVIQLTPVHTSIKAITEVTNVLVSSSLNVLHDEQLKETDEAEDLHSTPIRDRVGAKEGSQTIGVGGKRVAGIIDASREVGATTCSDLSKEGKLGDTAVLKLNVTETVETLLVGVIEQSQGIEEAERRLGTKLGLEGVEGGGGLAGLDRGEGGGGADEGSDDGGLHGDTIIVLIVMFKYVSHEDNLKLRYFLHQKRFIN